METEKRVGKLRKGITGRRIDLSGLGLLATLVVVCLAFGLLSPQFFTVTNLFTILLSVTVVGIAAVGGTLVMIAGGMDLSVESIIAFSGTAVALMDQRHLPLMASVLIGFSVGPIVGLLNGLLIAKAKINAVIVTLATMSLARGTALLLAHGTTVSLTRTDFAFIGGGYLFRHTVPVGVLFLVAVYIVFYFILNYTPLGRNIYSVGGNPTASRLSGINVEKYVLLVYTIAGAVSALSGLLFASIIGTGMPYGASGYTLNVIAAVILGGVSLTGGVGRVQGTLIAVLILGVIGNGLVLLNIQSFWQQVVTGAVLLVAVALDQIRVRSKA